MSAFSETAVVSDGDKWPHATPPRRQNPRFCAIDTTDRGLPVVGVTRRSAADELFPLVYRQMRSLAGGKPDFDDLVQIAAEQALRSFSSFGGRSKLATWTYRICYVTVLRHERWYRRWLRRFTLSEEGELDVNTPAPDAPSLEEFERAARLRQALEQVSPKQRTVVVLHDLEGRGIEDIAAVVGANPLTVRSRLRDGRRVLARILTADAYFGDDACRCKENER